jgi:hypothetical protein
MYEQQKDQMSNQQFNLDQTAFAIDTVKSTQVTVAAMSAAAKTLKKEQKKIDLNDLENMQDDMEGTSLHSLSSLTQAVELRCSYYFLLLSFQIFWKTWVRSQTFWVGPTVAPTASMRATWTPSCPVWRTTGPQKRYPSPPIALRKIRPLPRHICPPCRHNLLPCHMYLMHQTRSQLLHSIIRWCNPQCE